MPQATFADRLSRLRSAAGISAAELAGRAGISRQHVHSLERGAKQPTWACVVALANALKVSTESFRAKK